MGIKRNLAYNFTLSVSQVFLPLISIPYISRVLNPAGIGEVSFIDSFTFYFICIAEFGIGVYGAREVARVRNDAAKRDKVVSELIFLHIISSSVTVVLYLISVYFIWHKIHDIRILYFSFSYLLVNFFACEWYFLGMEKFRYITFRSLVTRVLGLISIFLLIRQPSDYFLYYAIIASSAMANILWNNYLLFREAKISFRNVSVKKHIGRLKVTYFISLVYSVTLLLDNVLLRMVSTSAVVGYYAFSIKIVRISSQLLSDSLLVFFPRIVSHLKNNDFKRVQLMITRNLQLLIFFSIPICVGVFLLAEPLVLVFFGKQFTPVIDNLKILAAFPLLKSYNHFLSRQVLISHNNEKLYLTNLIITSVVFIFLMLFLSFNFSDTGASWAIICTELLMLGINYYHVKRTSAYLKVFDSRAFLHAFGGALIFIPLVYLIKKQLQSESLVLAVAILGCFFSYLAVQAFVIKNDFAIILKSTFIFNLKNRIR